MRQSLSIVDKHSIFTGYLFQLLSVIQKVSKNYEKRVDVAQTSDWSRELHVVIGLNLPTCSYWTKLTRCGLQVVSRRSDEYELRGYDEDGYNLEGHEYGVKRIMRKIKSRIWTQAHTKKISKIIKIVKHFRK